ncbi:MAG: glycosyltransferase, partial [Bacteroidales bacterium]|nr:glycosyltransferase [Bacteroidales bacterium]
YIDLGVFVHHIDIYKELGGFDTNLRRLVDWDLILNYTKEYDPFFIPIILIDYSDDYNDEERISVKESYYLAVNEIKIKYRKNLKKITTVIPTYNQKHYLEKAIESAIFQEGDFIHEILVSDDGSDDGTVEIVREYEEKYPNLIFNISGQSNEGISSNFKKCIQCANGEYIAFLEGDDYWIDRFKLKKQLDFMNNNNDCSMLFSKIEVHNMQNNTKRFLKRQCSLKKNKLDGNEFIADPNLNLIANFSSCFFKADILKSIPELLYQSRINEIAIAFYFEQFGKIGYINEALSVYRQHENGVWTGCSLRDQLTSGLETRKIVKEICAVEYKDKIQKIIEDKYLKPLNEIV